jgi:hypothetical protein
MTFGSKVRVLGILSGLALIQLTGCGDESSDVSAGKRQGVGLPAELDGLALGPYGTVAVTDLQGGFAIVDGSGVGSTTRQPRLLLTTPTGLQAEAVPTARLANVSIWRTAEALAIVGLPCENIEEVADVSLGELNWFEVCGTRSHVVLRYELANRSWKTLSTSVKGAEDGNLRAMASNGDVLLAQRGGPFGDWVSISGRTGEAVEIPALAMPGEATACAIGDGFTAAVVPFDEPISDAPASFSDTVGLFRLALGGADWARQPPEPSDLASLIRRPLGCGPDSVMFLALGAPGQPVTPVQLVSDGPGLAWVEGPLEGFPNDGPPPAFVSSGSTVTAWDGPDTEAGGYEVYVLQDSAWQFIGRAAGPHPTGQMGNVAVSGGSVLFVTPAGDSQVLHLL